MNAAAEEWRPVPGFAGYEVSSLGRVRSRRARHGTAVVVLKQQPNKGYLRVHLTAGDGKAWRSVHVLVLIAFDRPKRPGEQCRHLNGDGRDNRKANLAWGTPTDNARDRDVHGRTARGARQGTHTKPHSVLRGERSPKAILTEGDVLAIREARARGERLDSLAIRYGVNRSTVHLAAKGKNWAHLPGATP